MNLGIIGLAQAGKKTAFRLLTGSEADKVPSRGGIRYGVASVRDPRVDALVDLYKPKKMKYAAFDIALPPDVKPSAARSAEWMEPLRKVDAFLHVARAFSSESVFHPMGSVDPGRDLSAVDTELLLADMDLVEKRLVRIEREKKRGDQLLAREKDVLERFKAHLDSEAPLRILSISEDDSKLVRNLQFFTSKPMIVVFNTGEDIEASKKSLEALSLGLLEKQRCVSVFLSAAIELELCDLPAEEQAEFMKSLGVAEPAAHRLSRAAYETLGLMSFFTVGEDEVRAWPLRRGASALEAAGRIHTDIERGFIRAETVAFEDLIRAGGEKAAKEQNLTRLNGKDYEVKDGDVLNIRFNV